MWGVWSVPLLCILYRRPSSVSLLCLLTHYAEMYPYIPPEDGPLTVKKLDYVKC